MKIVAIGGSPRANGNSNSLLRVAVEAAVERGATAEFFYPSQMDIAGCLGCDSCRRAPDAVCVQQDDMHLIYPAIKACDALVLASPVYFYAMSSWLKAVVDRCYALITLGPEQAGGAHRPEQWPRRVPPGKGFYFITTQEEDPPYYGYQMLSSMVYGMTWFDMPLKGHLVATGVNERHDWESREDLVAAARELIAVP
jgi:putative NADPH-quinone reductase